MTGFRNTVTIHRPTDEVFRFVANFENMPKWNYFVVDVHKLSPDSIGLGTVFHQTRKTDTQQYRVTEFDPGRRIAVETLPPAPGLVMRFTFEANGTTTSLTDEWEFGVGGGLSLPTSGDSHNLLVVSSLAPDEERLGVWVEVLHSQPRHFDTRREEGSRPVCRNFLPPGVRGVASCRR